MASKAKFSNKTKQEILDRDVVCIICWDQWTDCHHVRFWMEANRWSDRNETKEWCILCRSCHEDAHAFKAWFWVRQDCINYLNKLLDMK